MGLLTQRGSYAKGYCIHIENSKNFNIFDVENLSLQVKSMLILTTHLKVCESNKKKLSKNLLPVDLSSQNSITEVMLEFCDPLF